jgi:hypothetical protein
LQRGEKVRLSFKVGDLKAKVRNLLGYSDRVEPIREGHRIYQAPYRVKGQNEILVGVRPDTNGPKTGLNPRINPKFSQIKHNSWFIKEKNQHRLRKGNFSLFQPLRT